MAIRQLSVFLENKKGTLHEITGILADAGIDLRTMCIADTAEYGIVRIVANDPIKARQVLSDAGHVSSIRKVNAFVVPDTPGGLSKALALLETNGVNIEYLYALTTGEAGKACAVMRTGDTEKADEILTSNNIELLGENTL